MANPHADQLVIKARQGVRLTTVERRHAVGYMMAHEPDESNVSMARIFGVTERTIRDDKAYIRTEYANYVKGDDISRVIADIGMCFDRQISDLERAKKDAGKTEKGRASRTYLEFCKTIFNLTLAKVTALQNLGYYPKNLGTMTTQTFEFVASVGMLDESGKAAPAKVEAGRAPMAALDAEFADIEDGTARLMLPQPVGT